MQAMAVAYVEWQAGLRLITREPSEASIRNTMETLKKNHPLNHEVQATLRLVHSWPLLLLRARELLHAEEKEDTRKTVNRQKAQAARTNRLLESPAEKQARIAKRKKKDAVRKAKRKAAAEKKCQELLEKRRAEKQARQEASLIWWYKAKQMKKEHDESQTGRAAAAGSSDGVE